MFGSLTPPSNTGAAHPTSLEGVAAIDRAFAILFAFRTDDNGLSLAEFGTRTGLYKSTILRSIVSLTSHQMLVRWEDRRYYIGPAALQLGVLYQRGLRLGDVILPLMRALRDQSGESVSFYIQQESLRVCLYRLDSTRTIRRHVREGDVLPMSSGSGGLVLTAFSRADGVLYERIRKDGYCISIGQRDAETAGISAPVFSDARPLAGVFTLAAPRLRADEASMRRARKPVLETALKASELLGGNTTPLRRPLSSIDREEAG